jgi:PAS domain S-box-containing protein
MRDRPTGCLTVNNTSPFSEEEALSLILNNAEARFLLVDKDLRIVCASKLTKEKINEYFAADITPGMSVLELVPPERTPELIKLYQDVFNGEEKTSVVEINVEGSINYIENLFRPARNKDGEIVGAVISSKNITQIKKEEVALKEAEERWRFALEGSNQGVWDWNLETNDILYSASYKKMYGFQEHELQNMLEEWEKRIHPDDRKKVYAAIEEHKSSVDPYYESIYRIKGKDERYRWILARGMIVGKNAEGKSLRMIGTHTDITDRVNAEENYKVLFYNNPLSMWTYDSDSLRFLDVNNAAIQHYGYSRAEFLSMTIKDIRPEEDAKPLISLLEEFKEIDFVQSTWRHKKKNGEIIYVEVATNKLERNGENIVLVITKDITDKVKAQNELIKSNERFSYAAKASSDALWEWNIVTGEVYISEAYTEIFGWDVNEERKFDEWHDYIHPADKKETIEGYYKAIEDSTVRNWSKEYRYLKADGNYATVIDKAIILRDKNGKAIKVIGAIQDITERKRLEQELLHKELERQKAINQATVETQEQERSEIGKELHDNVNQVLTTTKLYLDLALSNSELKDELIEKSKKNISNIIKEIRQLSRSLMDPSIGDLGLIDSIDDLIESINLTKKLNIRLTADKDIESLLSSNHKLTVFRIIQEVLNNAIRHSNATKVSINFAMMNNMSEIIIEDDGVGFHPTSIKKGAGLKNIENRIYLINGTCSILSAPGSGSKIVINFPINNESK